jgi:hypothetical protein
MIDVRFLPNSHDEARFGSRSRHRFGLPFIILFDDDPEWCLSWCWDHDSTGGTAIYKLSSREVAWG